jgi:hypothetical protein
MKFSAEIGSGAMIYIPSFVKIGSGIQKLVVVVVVVGITGSMVIA